MKKILLSLCASLLIYTLTNAQYQASPGSSEILHALKKLNTTGSVLYIAAHPDDENTRLLAYLANEKRLRTGYLSLTRGDGGQNLIGKEQGELLGLIRTQELLAARRTDGAEQFFTRANDFGFSKNPDETFSIWNRDSILYDVVLTIRRFRPDVIICRFPTTGEGGHGHHTASAMLAVEAFDAAADPKKFPDQLSAVQVWQSKRIFWNTFNFGTTNTTSPDQLQMDVGVFNPLLGKSYGEIASESRSMHKSQGFGSARQRGTNVEFFKYLKGDSAKGDIMDGVNIQWSRLKHSEKVEKAIAEVISSYSAESPEKSIPGLTSVYKALTELSAQDADQKYWKQIKLQEAEKLILACSGLWLEAIAQDHSAVPGESLQYSLQAVNRSSTEIVLNAIIFPDDRDSVANLVLKKNEQFNYKRKEQSGKNISFSSPYWLQEKHTAGRFVVTDKRLIGTPENDPALRVIFKITVAGLPLEIERKLAYKFTDPVKGEIYRPLELLPPATVNFTEKVFAFSGRSTKNIVLQVKAHKAGIKGEVKLTAPAGWNVLLGNSQFSLAARGDEILIEATLTPDRTAANGTLLASVSIDGNVYSESIRRIDYDHIPSQFILSKAEAGLVTIDLKKAGTTIAYIAGAGDDVAASLKQVGYNVTILTEELLKHEDLSKYSAIVTGIRAYNINDKLHLQREKLMSYVRNGGNLVVQYNTNSRVGPLQASIGPYPFVISRDRVTNETAPVVFRNDKHPVLNFPNKITQADFEGWIQERGIYFATELDKNYETILAMSDPNEKSHEGSLIIGKYGKGNFVYTGLVFFRELPAGVPGAYRLFANLLSLPKNK